MSASSRGVPIDGLSVGNLSDSDGSSDGGWSPGSGSEADMRYTANLFSVALQHGGGGALAADAGSALRAEESDKSGQAKPAAARTACSTTKS